MRNIKLVFKYDGTDFYGFQRQISARTVQGELEKILLKIMKEDITMISAGRTDRGVHASMQVSNFFTNCPIPTDKILLALSNALPQDISILSVEEVPSNFSARFSAKERSYKYFLTFTKDPFTNRFATYTPEKIDLEKFLKILKPLEGVHNFKNFKLADCASKHQNREIYLISGKQIDSNNIVIEIKGNAFLKSQIRIIIGLALEIYLNRKPQDYFKKMLTDFSMEYVKVVAPPNGLFLSDITYFENLNYSKTENINF